jgi:hypothetical protein
MSLTDLTSNNSIIPTEDLPLLNNHTQDNQQEPQHPLRPIQNTDLNLFPNGNISDQHHP